MIRSLFLILCLLILTPEIQAQEKKKWIAPDSANYILNPHKDDMSLIGTAAALFVEHCILCHGAAGDGKGVAASSDIIPSDLTSADVQKQTDGVLFWKLSHGHDRMIAYRAVLTEKQRWAMVNYIRALAK